MCDVEGSSPSCLRICDVSGVVLSVPVSARVAFTDFRCSVIEKKIHTGCVCVCMCV